MHLTETGEELEEKKKKKKKKKKRKKRKKRRRRRRGRREGGRRGREENSGQEQRPNGTCLRSEVPSTSTKSTLRPDSNLALVYMGTAR